MSTLSPESAIATADAAPFNVRDFRNALGAFVTGVTVVTSNADGRPVGFTANSFSSVSLDPPLISVCIGKTSSNFDTFGRSNVFNVNILSEQQRQVSKTFATKGIDRFAQAQWTTGELGAPIIDQASAWFECSVHQRVDAGDHQILIGHVRSFGHNTNSPLGFCRGNYVLFHLEQEIANLTTKRVRVGALIETTEGVLMIPDEGGRLVLPSSHKLGSRAASGGLYQKLDALIDNFEVDFLFSVWEDKDDDVCNIYYRGTAEGQLRSKDVQVVPVSSLTQVKTTPDLAILLSRYVREREDARYSVYPGFVSSP